MTIAMLAEHGIPVRRAGDSVWHVDPHDIPARDRSIEPDLSNAAPFLAAALVSGGRVQIPDWPRRTVQPGAAIVDLLVRMGGSVDLGDDGLTVTGTGEIHGLDADLRGTGELAPTIAALAALAQGPSRLTGIAHLRGHETDRLAAIAAEITSLGGRCVVEEDGLAIDPGPLHGGIVRTYADHRMATFAAILGLRVPGIAIEDIATTDKTLPDFPGRWTQMVETAR
jgi:3-phosphoshikimate 1-carboxyvinyltransferase